jgi:hypothetical protein
MAQRWQYMMQVVEGRRLEEELNELGAAGWELITAHWEEYSYGGRTQMQARCILKRPVEDDRNRELRGEYWGEPASAGLS